MVGFHGRLFGRTATPTPGHQPQGQTVARPGPGPTHPTAERGTDYNLNFVCTRTRTHGRTLALDPEAFRLGRVCAAAPVGRLRPDPGAPGRLGECLWGWFDKHGFEETRV